MFFLAKAVGLLTDPWYLPLLLLIVAGGLRLAKRLPRVRRTLPLVAVGMLWLFSTGAVANLLLTPLEHKHRRPKRLPQQVGAIVMFSGQLDNERDMQGYYELTDASDRFVETVRLARRFPEALVVLSGGTGDLLPEGKLLEAKVLGRLARDLGLAERRLRIEIRSRTTRENAVETAKVLKGVKGRVVLVTSAAHMPRSMACMAKVGLRVIPWPVDFRKTGYGIGAWIPKPWTMERSRDAIHEHVGLLAYWMLGYI